MHRIAPIIFPSFVRCPTLPLSRQFSTNIRREAEARLKRVKRAPLAPLDLHGKEILDSNGTEVAPKEKSGLFEREVRYNMKKHSNAILLTQVGTFYESYFEQAGLVAKLLSVKLASKSFGGIYSPFSGFPTSQLSKHVATLLSSGRRVVIIEEYKVDGKIHRKVVRIATPGTGLEESIEEEGMKFLVGISVRGDEIGLAYRDISTGASFSKMSGLDRILNDLSLIGPKEILLQETGEMGIKLKAKIEVEAVRNNWMMTAIPLLPMKSISLEEMAEEILLQYLSTALPSAPTQISPTTSINEQDSLQLDATTLASLEIKKSLRGGVKGSLLHGIDRTVTNGGKRLLSERIGTPSTHLDIINSRLDLVEYFHNDNWLRQDLQGLLRKSEDGAKLLQKIFLGRGNAFDLIGMKNSIVTASEIREIVKKKVGKGQIDLVVADFLRLEDEIWRDVELVGKEIANAVDEEALMKRTLEMQKRAEVEEVLGRSGVERMEDGSDSSELWGNQENWVIKTNTDPVLAGLHEKLSELRTTAQAMQTDLAVKFSTPTLVLKTIPKIGPILHIQSKAAKSPFVTNPAFVSVAKSGSTKCYSYSNWSKLYSEITKATAVIRSYETRSLAGLTTRLLDNYLTLNLSNEITSALDVTLSFADLASDSGYVRPVINHSTDLYIEEGQHPTVSQSLLAQSRTFVANSLSIEKPTSILFITGSNAAGKSTFLRQSALLVILAQMGSFVPAKSMKFGLVDRIFTRIGARDELDRDKSTFVVEMEEAGEILSLATEKSLVLFDEVGRGTSPKDGLAISFATLEHLLNVNQSRSLFATHFHDLAPLVGYHGDSITNSDKSQQDILDSKVSHRGKGEWNGIEFWCTTSIETADGNLEYSYDMRPGMNSDSSGIAVARACGLPSRAIATATALRDKIERLAEKA